MPWGTGGNSGNGNGGGPFKPGNPGPWGQGPRNPGPWGAGPGGGASQPNLGDILQRLRDRFGGGGGSGGSGGGSFFGGGVGAPGVLILVAIAIGLWLLSGFYTIGPNQVGLNLVWGRYVGKTSPGLNYNWPYPGRRCRQAQRDRPQRLQRRLSVTRPDFSRPNAIETVDVPEESLMLTGDENIADVKFRGVLADRSLAPRNITPSTSPTPRTR